jgi:hypothetical protein
LLKGNQYLKKGLSTSSRKKKRSGWSLFRRGGGITETVHSPLKDDTHFFRMPLSQVTISTQLHVTHLGSIIDRLKASLASWPRSNKAGLTEDTCMRWLFVGPCHDQRVPRRVGNRRELELLGDSLALCLWWITDEHVQEPQVFRSRPVSPLIERTTNGADDFSSVTPSKYTTIMPKKHSRSLPRATRWSVNSTVYHYRRNTAYDDLLQASAS